MPGMYAVIQVAAVVVAVFTWWHMCPFIAWLCMMYCCCAAVWCTTTTYEQNRNVNTTCVRLDRVSAPPPENRIIFNTYNQNECQSRWLLANCTRPLLRSVVWSWRRNTLLSWSRYCIRMSPPRYSENCNWSISTNCLRLVSDYYIRTSSPANKNYFHEIKTTQTT